MAKWSGPDKDMRAYVQRVVVALLLVALALLIWRASHIFILLFGAILVAVFLRGLAELITAHTPLSPPWAMGIVLVLITVLTLGLGWMFGTQISAQFSDLAERLPGFISDARAFLAEKWWGQPVAERMHEMAPDGSSMVSIVTGFIGTVAGTLTSLVLMLIVGLYLAFQPRLYRTGILLLAPPDRQKHIAELLAANGRALWLWLIAQFVVMALIGVLTFIGLTLLGIPMALALALLAAILEFVPVIGPVIAAIPAVLVALGQGPTTALYVVLLYVLVQQVESNLIQPVVQRKAVSLPPVVTLVSIAFFGLLFGLIGVLFATPLAVVAYVTVNIVYVGHVLGHEERITRFQKPGLQKR